MKILMTSDTYLPRLGGGEYHVHYLLKELRAQGHDVTFVTTEKGKWEKDGLYPVVRISYVGLLSLWPIIRLLWRLSEDADLFHAHYSTRLGFLAGFVAMLRRKPFVVTQHGLGLLPPANASAFHMLVFRVWRHLTMKWARVIISTSEDMSVEIRACGFGSKIVAISNGYDDALFQPLPEPPADHPHLLTVRRLNPKNGVQYLIAALPFLRENHPDIRVTCVGDGPWRDHIVQLAKDLRVDDCVTFEGPVDHARLKDFYREATAVIMPSTAESTSLTCIEAMAQRRIVIASKVGGLVELIGRNEERGYLADITGSEHSEYDAPFSLPEESIRRLADRISYALTHRDESQAKAQEASAYAAKHFTWGMIARRTAEEAYLPALKRLSVPV